MKTKIQNCLKLLYKTNPKNQFPLLILPNMHRRLIWKTSDYTSKNYLKEKNFNIKCSKTQLKSNFPSILLQLLILNTICKKVNIAVQKTKVEKFSHQKYFNNIIVLQIPKTQHILYPFLKHKYKRKNKTIRYTNFWEIFLGPFWVTEQKGTFLRILLILKIQI